jgi:hypothetical protein
MMRLLVGRGERTLSTLSSVLLGLTQAVDSGVPPVVAVNERKSHKVDESSAGGPEPCTRIAGYLRTAKPEPALTVDQVYTRGQGPSWWQQCDIHLCTGAAQSLV